jgi:hypothetical protein
VVPVPTFSALRDKRMGHLRAIDVSSASHDRQRPRHGPAIRWGRFLTAAVDLGLLKVTAQATQSRPAEYGIVPGFWESERQPVPAVANTAQERSETELRAVRIAQ